MTSIPMAMFWFFAWLLESLFISSEPRPETSSKKDDSSGSSSSSKQSKPSGGNNNNGTSEGTSSSGNNNHTTGDNRACHDYSDSLQSAFRYFEIDNPKEATWEAIKKKYRRLSLIHHPDRNNHSDDSKQEMQKINNFYELLEQEFERRGGNKPTYKVPKPSKRAEDATASTCSTTYENDSSSDRNHSIIPTPADPDDPDEPGVSREEYKRRRKLKKQQRQKAEKRAKDEAKRREELRKESERLQREEQWQKWRQQRREEERRRKEREQEREREMRRQWEEAKQNMQEFQRRQKEMKQNNIRMKKEKNLDTEIGRNMAYEKWKREIQNIRLKDANGNDDIGRYGKPCNPIMEYSTEDVAMALRLSLTDVAIELVHETLQDCKRETMQQFGWKKAVNNMPMDYTGEDHAQLCNSMYKNVLVAPLDEDGNHLLHYVIYYEDIDLLTFLTTHARWLDRYPEYITSTNRRGSTILDFCVGSSNSAFRDLVKALYEEGRKQQEIKARATSVIFQSQHYFQQVRQHGNLGPALLTVYSILLGKLIFGVTYWQESLLVVLVSRLSLSDTSDEDLCISLVLSHSFWYLFRSLAVLAGSMFPLWAFLCTLGFAKLILSFYELTMMIPSILLVSCEYFFLRLLGAVHPMVPSNYKKRLGLAFDVIVMCSVVLLLRWLWSFVPVNTFWKIITMEEDGDFTLLGKPLLRSTPREVTMVFVSSWFQRPKMITDEL